jgi:putative membrane protein
MRANRAIRRGAPTFDAGESNMLSLILVWILNAVALLVVAYLLPGIAVASFGSALLAALVLGLLNMLVKPVLVLLTLPITIVTLGLFLIILNALLFWFAGSILKGFQVNGFWWAVIGAVLYSIISGLLSTLLVS